MRLLSRTLTLREGVRLDLRGEAFNVTNTAQFANPATGLGTSAFGYITSTLASGAGVNGAGAGRLCSLP